MTVLIFLSMTYAVPVQTLYRSKDYMKSRNNINLGGGGVGSHLELVHEAEFFNG